MEIIDKPIKLWSKRFTVAMGKHWKLEQECMISTAQHWLDKFRSDEPDVMFMCHFRSPRK